jgi:glycerol uptake facilitator-like aquaporin
LGYLAGTFLLYLLVPSKYSGSASDLNCLGCLKLRYEIGSFYGIMAEYLGGLMLMFVYYAYIIDKRSPKNMYGAAIGLTVGLWNMTFGNKYTVGINPFRFLAGCFLNRYVSNSQVLRVCQYLPVPSYSRRAFCKLLL